MTRPRKKQSRRRPNRPPIEEALAARRDLIGAQFQSLDDPFAKMLSAVATHEVVDDQLVVSGNLDDAGRERLGAEAKAAVPRLTAAVGEGMADLRRLLSSIHPMGALVRVCWANLLRVGDYFEPTFHGSEPKVEMLAGLLLSAEALDSASPDPPDPELVQRIFDALDTLGLLMRLLVIATNISWEDDRSDLRVWSQLRWLSLRGASYVPHATELARKVLRPLDDQMSAELGFTVDDVIRFAEDVDHLMEERANALLARAQDEASGFVKAVLSAEESDPNVQAVLQAEGPAGVFARAALARVEYEMSEALSMTYSELAESDPALGDKLQPLRALVAPFGAIPRDAYRTAFDVNPLRSTPFVEWQDRIALPVPGLLMRDYMGVLEPILMDRVPAYVTRAAEQP